jgi:two-component sensor histidine kinase
MTQERDDVARVASEMRHRMANTFQLMSALARMRGQKAGDAETRRQLVWMADAIGALGALERHRTPQGVDFTAYLTEMTPIWRRRQAGQSAEVRLAAQPVFAPDQAASTLALIIQELVGNALAHGYPDGRAGEVDVRLSNLPDRRWELVVADDGCGFDPGGSAARERFGLWFVRSLAAQVRGEFSLVSQPSCTGRLVFAL